MLRRFLSLTGWAAQLAALLLAVVAWNDRDARNLATAVVFLAMAGITLRWAAKRPRLGLRELALGGAFLGSLALFGFADAGWAWPVIAATGIWIAVEFQRDDRPARAAEPVA